MDPREVEAALQRAEAAVTAGHALSGTGFWKAVGAMRRDRTLAVRYAERAAVIDRRAFESAVKLRVPAPVGTLLLAAGTGAGIVMLALSTEASSPFDILLFLAGFGALDLFTHSLAHWLVGRLVGIRFTHYFLGGPPPPRPGAKTDYASYLLVSSPRRALMHASGAVVTKVVPFLMVPIAVTNGLPGWVLGVLLVVGVGQIVTDVLFSTKTSDWMKVKRELSAS